MIVAPQRRAHVAAVASAMPEHRIDQATAIATLTSLFPEEHPALIRQLVERSGVEERYLARTPEDGLQAWGPQELVHPGGTGRLWRLPFRVIAA